MPPIARTACRVEDCPEPRHVFPNGAKSTYCKAHNHLRKKSRQGHLNCTGAMAAVLTYLLKMEQADQPFVELHYPLAHGITLNKLIERDWIFASPGEDGVRYRITGRGKKELAYFHRTFQRRDGLCPACCERPRHITKGGKKAQYCLPCERESAKRERELGIVYDNLNAICPRCKKKPRHVYPGGKRAAHCAHCAKVIRRKNARKGRRSDLQRVLAGEVLICMKCKQEPRYVSKNTVYKYCLTCQGAIWDEQRARRAALGKPLRSIRVSR